MPRKQVSGLGPWLKKSVWTFPIVLFIILALFTAFRISGTSAGVYYPILYGKQAKDPNLIYGHPRAIRSDEWLVGAQKAVDQSKLGFPKNNPDQGDLSLSLDTPNKDWSTVFKPQLWGYFIMPLENAYAFKWWLVMYLLVVGCYFFILRILPGKKWFALIMSVAFGLSPFLLWWYQSAGFMPLAYGFLILILLMRLLNSEAIPWIKNQRVSDGLQVAALAFLSTCFGLILYPPFQIPVAVVMLFFGLGYLAHKRYSERVQLRVLGKRVGLVFIGLIIAGLIGLLFIHDNRQAIHNLNNTVYPGKRTVVSGGMPLLQMFDGFVMPAEQSDFRGAHFFTNQSEASNFILLMPFLVLPGLALIAYEWHKQRRADWVFIALEVCGLLFLIRAFTPYGSPFYKLLFLQKVPNNGRLIIGFGFLGMVQLIYLVKKIPEAKIPKKTLWPLVLLYGLSCFIVLLWTGVFIREHYPEFLRSLKLIIAFAAAFTAIIMAFLANKKMLAAILFLGFTLLSTFRVMPLYRGLGILTHNDVIQQMAAVSKPGDSWVTVGNDSAYYEDFGWLAGRRSLSGLHAPNPAFWEQLAGPSYEDIYNRSGHAFFSDDPTMQAPLGKLQSDAFEVKFQCSSFIEKNAQFALSVHPLTESCVHLIKTVKYPAKTFYLYKIAG
ncbi:MAG TPA: hypothetical protein VHD84_03410 [Candidatus Saccharimonadales bacterium]|nr:hypothetical protein [Candidatus Saccharimonadales bacterium]